jgi:type VI secretion system protein ImpH
VSAIPDYNAEPATTGAELAALANLPASKAIEPAAPAALTPLERLEREPTRFSIDHAAAVIAPGRDPLEITYRSSPLLGAPGGEVTRARPGQIELRAPTFGLIGPGGVLPRHYTAWVDAELRKRSTALHAFFDLLSRRFTGLYVKAGAKYRPTRDPSQAEQVQAAAVGLGTPHLASALATPLPAVLYHAGGLAARSRSVERLRGMLSEETGANVQIIEFAGTWVRLPPAEQSRLAAPGLPGRYVQLGVDAAVGVQVWDPPARFLVRLGPLRLRDFEALLPGTPQHTRLVELIRLHVGPEQDFAFNPSLPAAEVPPLRLGAGDAGSARLGWTSWLTMARPRRRTATQAMLQPLNT